MLAIRHLTIRALTVAVVLFVACTSSEIKPPFPTATDVAATATPEAI